MSSTTHLITADEFMRLSDDGHRYELVKGELLTMSPPGGEHGATTMRLSRFLANHIEDEHLGIAFAAETGFKLEHDPDTVLAPDFAFVCSERLSNVPLGYVNIAPDLVVEVISPTQSSNELRLKAEEWIRLGAKLVWVVQPKTRTVEVFLTNGERFSLDEHDELNGGEVVPGFSVRLSEIFSY